MVQLYIDDGVPGRGHRTNILGDGRLTGIAYCQHKVYGGMLVIVYAGGFELNDTGREELARRGK